MSAPHRPGMFSIATTAAPTSSSVTIRCRAARETNSRSASAGVVPVRSASRAKFRVHPRALDRSRATAS